MAHWIFERLENGTRIFTCSNCGHICHENRSMCPNCRAHIDKVRDRKEVKTVEAIAVDPTPMKDVVILSIEKYDEIMSDLVKLGEDLEVANRDKERCLDILKRLGVDEDNAKRIVPDTGELIDTRINPYTTRKKVIFSFEVDDDRRVK